jgi:dTDP-4-dehydrorhamnose 3,5-epimerase
MTFTETALAGAFIIDIVALKDDRGFFARTWAADELKTRGLDPTVVQCNVAWNPAKGTLRGMHFQRAPYDEVKIIRCTRGSLFDVIVDLRPESPTFRKWTSVELNANSRRMLYVPKGFAHGYLTLTDDVEAHYHVSAPYTPACADGVAWNDPAFGIEWPFAPTVMSERDRTWPHFNG